MSENKSVTVNGRSYKWPTRPVIAVCVDGSEGTDKLTYKDGRGYHIECVLERVEA